eukprot:4979718-Prymnesium_polylepis.1
MYRTSRAEPSPEVASPECFRFLSCNTRSLQLYSRKCACGESLGAQRVSRAASRVRRSFGTRAGETLSPSLHSLGHAIARVSAHSRVSGVSSRARGGDPARGGRWPLSALRPKG